MVERLSYKIKHFSQHSCHDKTNEHGFINFNNLMIYTASHNLEFKRKKNYIEKLGKTPHDYYIIIDIYPRKVSVIYVIRYSENKLHHNVLFCNPRVCIVLHVSGHKVSKSDMTCQTVSSQQVSRSL